MCEMIGASKQGILLAFTCQPKQRVKQICQNEDTSTGSILFQGLIQKLYWNLLD